MLKSVRLAFFLACLLWGMLSSVVDAQGSQVDVLHVKGTVNPVLADYIDRGIKRAESDGATALVIQMDTPGGLDTAMRDIVQNILNAKIPVVVYVSPSGARAASAGVFITMSAHIAAMATNTATGAAHPVSLGSDGGSSDTTMTEKVVNDAAAYIRSIATTRGRNADWAEKAVRESVSITEKEALDLHVIDIVAPDLNDLMRQLNGRQVTLIDGSQRILNTSGAVVRNVNMSWVEDFLYTIADPNIAYILLSIGSLGIMAEIFNPGMIFPGVVGAISLLLGLYALGMMSVNWVGVLLIILAFALFIAEFFTSGFGVLFAGGLASLIVGSLLLFKGASPVFSINWWVIALVVGVIAAFVVFAVFKIVQSKRRQAATGREELKGKIAVARTALEPEGMVFYEGELWNAISTSGPVKPGEEVVIAGLKGLKLQVSRINKD